MAPRHIRTLARLLGGAGMPPPTPATWELLLAQARVGSLWARLGEHAAAHDLADLPAPVALHLAAGRKVGQAVRTTVSAEVLRLAAPLAAAGLPCVLLKGAAYLAADLPPARGRVFADIDILVPQADIGRAELTLLAAGWVCQGIDAYDMRYYRRWMHEIPPLTHVHRHSVIDLHHTITPPTSSFAVDGARLLAHARCIDAARNLWVLQPVDMVLHSAVHLFSEGEFDHGVRDMLDMLDLVRHFSAADAGFWPHLLARAAELRLQRPLHHALQALHLLFGHQVPAVHAAAVRALQPPAPQRWMMAWLLARALKPPHPACHQPGDGFAHWLLYVRSHWLRMPLRLLVPHLLRKAWMRRFPPDSPAAEGGAVAPPG